MAERIQSKPETGDQDPASLTDGQKQFRFLGRVGIGAVFSIVINVLPVYPLFTLDLQPEAFCAGLFVCIPSLDVLTIMVIISQIIRQSDARRGGSKRAALPSWGLLTGFISVIIIELGLFVGLAIVIFSGPTDIFLFPG